MMGIPETRRSTKFDIYVIITIQLNHDRDYLPLLT
jgi:hypothetical protein